LVIMPQAKRKPMNGFSISRTDVCQLMMNSVLDDLWPKTRPKMWHKFDEGILHTEFVPPRRTVSGKFYCDILRWQRENIWRKRPDKWCNNSLGPTSWHSSSRIAHCAAVFGFYKVDSHSPPSLLTGPHHLWFFPIPKEEIEAQDMTFWQQWRDPDQITGRDKETDEKWLPAVLLIMKIPLGSLYQCRRGLMWRG
jgi:hypothetical protein